MNLRIWLFSGMAMTLLILGLGCGAKVMVPPEIDLKGYENVGLIDFTFEAEGNLGRFVTQKFLEEVSASQKGVRIIELGSMDEVLNSVQRDKLDPEAIRAIGRKHNLRSIIVGELEVSDIKPKVSIFGIITHMSVRAEVEAVITAKLLDAEQAATIWTDSARDKKEVAHVSIFSGGVFHFDAENPEEAYGDLAESLIDKVTADLRVSYRRM